MKKENIMFKKTLLAVSLLGVASHGAASTLAVTETVTSPQAVTTSTELAAADAITLTTNQASIAAGAVLKLTFSAAPNNATLIDQSSTGDCAALSYSGTTDAGKTLNYTLTAAVLTGCEIHFGDNDKDGTPAGDVTATFDIADVGTTPVTVSASFSDIGDGIDPATAVDVISKAAADQYSVTVAGTSKIVNVENERKSFTAGADDTITITFGDTGPGLEVSAASTDVTFEIDGDFGWADDAATAAVYDVAAGAIGCTTTGGGAVTVGTGASAPTASLYTFNVAAPVNGDVITCTLTPQVGVLAVELPQDDFDVSGTVAFTDEEAAAGTQAIASTDAGQWGINGASVKVFSVPFGAEVESHSIFVSNSGDTTGAITGRMVWNGNAPVDFSLGNISANANKYLNVIDALGAEKPTFGRADITFTVNAPAAAITFTAGYTTAAGRANLFMEQQANIDGISSSASSSAATAATQSTTAATQSTAAASSADTACANLAAGLSADDAGAGAADSGDGVYATTACP
jgi:hypothetical protein